MGRFWEIEMKKLIFVFALHTLFGLIGIKLLVSLLYANKLALFLAFFIFSFFLLVSSYCLNFRFVYFVHLERFMHYHIFYTRPSYFSFKFLWNAVGINGTVKIFLGNLAISLFIALIVGLLISWFRNYTAIGLIMVALVYLYDRKLFDKNVQRWFETVGKQCQEPYMTSVIENFLERNRKTGWFD